MSSTWNINGGTNRSKNIYRIKNQRQDRACEPNYGRECDSTRTERSLHHHLKHKRDYDDGVVEVGHKSDHNNEHHRNRYSIRNYEAVKSAIGPRQRAPH